MITITEPSAVSPRRFAGWKMLAVAIVTSVMTGPGQTIGVSVFIDHFVADLRLSRPSVGAAYLIGTLAGAIAMPAFGRFVDRRGIRLAQILVGIGFALALVNMAAVTNLIWLAIGFAGIRMLGQGALSMVTSVTVALWFSQRRGLSMGILATVASAGMALVPLGLNASIEAVGWRVSWLVAAGVVLAVVPPLGRWVLVDRPSDIGQMPDGIEVYPDVDEPSASAERSLDRAAALRTREFWVLVAVSSAAGMLVTGLNFHQIDLLGEVDLSASEAAAMFLPQVIGASLAGLIFGGLMDRLGIKYAPMASGALLLAVHLLAAALAFDGLVFVYAVTLGATVGATRAVTSTMAPAYFGTAYVGSIQGVMTVAMVAGSAIGPVALSIMEEWAGSYTQANLLLAAIPAVLVLFAFFNRSLPDAHQHYASKAAFS